MRALVENQVVARLEKRKQAIHQLGISSDWWSENKRMTLELEELDTVIGTIESLAHGNVCVASFSEVGDSLSQWRAYAPVGGVSIGINSGHLSKLTNADRFTLARCLYDYDEQKEAVSSLIDKVLEENCARQRNAEVFDPKWIKGGNVSAYLYRYAPVLKDSAFKEEREWRIVSPLLNCQHPRFEFRAGPSALIPYFKFPLAGENEPFPLDEIVIGPTPELALAMASIRTFLVSQGLNGATIRHSEVPYRKW